MRVLKITGQIDINLDIPEGSEVTTVSLQDYLETEYEHPFDFIFCVHVLQTLWAKQVGAAVEKLIHDLAHMGEIHLYVPAAEQAAKSMLKGETDPVIFYLLWGTEDQPSHTGFTLLWIRALLVQYGALVRRAEFSRLSLSFNDKESNVLGHYLLATTVKDR
jgi:hypothetical protein